MFKLCKIQNTSAFSR